ncbi:MAG: T9SS type A sorting domain-containing protein [Flavipsychrobacter sp.]|nr:T9SS type A sorting domain-containing protein [Flavipsychrobacter sp.]
MKRTVRFLSVFAGLFLSLCATQKAAAQVTSITASYFDSATLYCTTPALVQGWGSYFVTGTILTNDSIDISINFGDGSSDNYRVATQTQGGFNFSHTYNTTGNYQVSITLTNTINTSATDNVMGSVMTITNSCAALTGIAYLDTDGDCTHDTGEEFFEGYLMKARNTSTNVEYYSYINDIGQYHITAPSGATYEISMANQPTSLNPVCPGTGMVTQTVSGGSYTHDFSYQCNTVTTTDFSVGGNAFSWRPGFNRTMSVMAGSDNICVPYPATVTLYLDPQLSYTSTLWGTAPTSTSGPIVWNVTSMSNLLSLYSYLSIYCDPGATMGDTLCNMLVITYTGVTDPNHANDTIQICAPVNNSYDPNIKDVFPAGEGALGKIAPQTPLTFTVHFQNTGNDTAYDVTIVDTLSAHLDVNSFQFMETSHPVNVTILPGNILNFRFEDIYLPDSNTNEPLSHGFLVYKATPKMGLASGTAINNTAYIYFDFNDAIITNTTLNTIDIPTGVYNVTNGSIAAKVYPNPANNELVVSTEGISNFTAQVFDIVGRPVATSVTSNGKVFINTSSLANGMYILQVSANGQEMTTKINIQH